MSWKVNNFAVGFKLKGFFFMNTQITIISITMQTQTQICFCFTKTKLILNFLFGEPKLPLILNKTSPSTKTLFLRLSPWDDELLSTPKIITFLAVSLSKVQVSAL